MSDTVITDEMRASWHRAGWKRELTPELLASKRHLYFGDRRRPCGCMRDPCPKSKEVHYMFEHIPVSDDEYLRTMKECGYSDDEIAVADANLAEIRARKANLP